MPYREMHNQDELDSSGSLLSRICKKCGVRKTPEEFHLTSDRAYRRRTCKRCAEASKDSEYFWLLFGIFDGRDIRDMILRKKLKPVGEERAKSFSEETA